jgi:hypothetical protein
MEVIGVPERMQCSEPLLECAAALESGSSAWERTRTTTAGNLLAGRMVPSSARGDPYTEWEYTCEREKSVLDSIAQLPLST